MEAIARLEAQGPPGRAVGDAMSDEPSLAEKVIDFIDEAQREATEAERERCWQAVAGVLNKAWKRAESSRPVWADLVNCRDALLPPDSQPPAPEPMTVEKMMKMLRTAFGLNLDGIEDDIEVNLTALLKAQARRDAEILSQREREHPPGWPKSMTTGWKAACRDGQDRILKAAGLE